MTPLTGETTREDCYWRLAIAYVEWTSDGTFADNLAELVHMYRLFLRGN
jgi:hypothetical protein